MTTTHNDAAFRRGVTAAIQAVVDDFTDLVSRRVASHSPELTTQTIVAMTRRIAERPYPSEDPGPADPDVPDVPRPSLGSLLVVAALAAEESGLPIMISMQADGLVVSGTCGGRQSVRAVSWDQMHQARLPVLSLAVQQVIDELRA